MRVILELEGRDVYWNMAVDEALLELKSSNRIPDTLRIYVIKPSAVTIGFFQKIAESVNLEYLHYKGVDVTRRITGGGAVYHDSQGELTYSVVLPALGPLSDITESFRVICSGLLFTLEMLNIRAMFVPVNDIVVNGKKISGSAQTRRRNFLLQHGTLMYNTNIEILENVLKVPPEKLSSKGVSRIGERVTTLRRILNKEIAKEELAEAMIKGFCNALGRECYLGEYSEEELSLAEELIYKYKDTNWIFRR